MLVVVDGMAGRLRFPMRLQPAVDLRFRSVQRAEADDLCAVQLDVILDATFRSFCSG
jgi:hypothetical protein